MAGKGIPCNICRVVIGSGVVVLGLMGGGMIMVRGGCRGWIHRGKSDRSTCGSIYYEGLDCEDSI